MLLLDEPRTTAEAAEKPLPAPVAEAADRARAEAEQAAAERRMAARLPKAMLPWLEVARLKFGATVGVVNLSSGGALIESSTPLKPGAVHALEISGGSKPVVARFGVLRSRIASLSPDKVVYRTACAFQQPLDLPELQVELPAPPAPASAAPAAEQEAAPAAVPSPAEAQPGAAGSEEPAAVLKSEPLDSESLHRDAAMLEGWQRVVARYSDGRMVKGYTNDFAVTRPEFTLRPTTDASAAGAPITIADLKAVFFVRDFDGDPARRERKTFAPACLGRKLEVRFNDGEVLLGTTPGYRTGGAGFFMTPADPRANNCRVFVVSGAIRNVRFV
jgi:hypothetical protein